MSLRSMLTSISDKLDILLSRQKPHRDWPESGAQSESEEDPPPMPPLRTLNITTYNNNKLLTEPGTLAPHDFFIFGEHEDVPVSEMEDDFDDLPGLEPVTDDEE